jgi:RNA polymerase sigma-70 factor (ECF subfamily)
MGLNFLKNAQLSKKTADELMSMIAEGHPKAFEVLFDRYSGKVLGYAKKMLGSLEKAEEASQDIWVKVVKQAPHYQKNGYFNTWVMTMVRNHCLNMIRKDKRLFFHEDVEVLIDEQSNAAPFENEILQKQDLEQVSKLMEALPEKQRIALTILITEEPSYEELAEQMGASVGAVKSMIHRARKTLQTQIKTEAV